MPPSLDPPANPEVEAWFAKNPTVAETVAIHRTLILATVPQLQESIKWNAPNYSLQNQDCLTFNVGKSNQLKLIFHRGAKSPDIPKLPNLPTNQLPLKAAAPDRLILDLDRLSDDPESQNQLQALILAWTTSLTS